MKLSIASKPDHERPFLGLGVQVDGYFYDEVNARAGYTDEDTALLARRLGDLRPGLARMFCDVRTWNPALDGQRLDWSHADLEHQGRLLRILQDAGTQVNLVLFQPRADSLAQLRPLVTAMLAYIEHLAEAGLDCVRWLTLYNEPESWFPHDSALVRRLFGEARIAERPGWEVYAELNRFAHEELTRRGLYPHVKLAAPDCVWGAPMRRERMRLAAQDLGDLDVTFAYHNYNPEWPEYYDHSPEEAADWAYAGMRAEAEEFRALAGPEQPLGLWEFNVPGHDFSHCFAGTTPTGEHVIETPEAGPELARKIFEAAAGGVDGFCFWTFTDMTYCHDPRGTINQFGLFRHKWQGLTVRPYYHYYAALTQALRPGCRLLPVEGAGDPVYALAARQEDAVTVAVVNLGRERREIEPALEEEVAEARVLRIGPETIDRERDRPADDWRPASATLQLGERELIIWRGRLG